MRIIIVRLIVRSQECLLLLQRLVCRQWTEDLYCAQQYLLYDRWYTWPYRWIIDSPHLLQVNTYQHKTAVNALRLQQDLHRQQPRCQAWKRPPSTGQHPSCNQAFVANTESKALLQEVLLRKKRYLKSCWLSCNTNATAANASQSGGYC